METKKSNNRVDPEFESTMKQTKEKQKNYLKKIKELRIKHIKPETKTDKLWARQELYKYHTLIYDRLNKILFDIRDFNENRERIYSIYYYIFNKNKF